MTVSTFDQRAISVIRGLAMDAPHAAASGHQGTAMALAPLAHVLWSRVMSYDPAAPHWPDRDRFVLSAGHASILQYAMLHLSGYDLTLDDLREFRQWESRTPGHPEVHHTPGVEVTTGPLGQGFANSVGFALAERMLRDRLGSELCDHRTWVIAGDGDLSEGVSHEAASLAGHLGLDRLTVVYDDNHISIDGPTELALSDDVVGRFRAYGWHVLELGEAAEDLDALEGALATAADETSRPTLIVLRSHIAYPSPSHTDDHEAHGYALKDEAIAEAKAVLGIPTDETFWVPDDVAAAYREVGARGRADREAWEARRAAWSGDHALLDAIETGRGLAGWDEKLPSWSAGESVATRKASQACVDALAETLPALVTGSADLTGNTGTKLPGGGVQSAEAPGGRQVHFGVREHAMGAAAVGMALHGGVRPAVGTFLVFSDYMRPSVRLAAISDAPAVFVWTHDSVGVGEDGPTHQPIEHVAALRAIPQLDVVRPADANETVGAWRLAVEADGPVALILTRQNVPVLDGTADHVADVARGGYVLVDTDGAPDIVLAGTGSEVQHCVGAAEALAAEGVAARVVSLPCWERFAALDEADRVAVFPTGVPALGVEAGVDLGWHRWVDDVVAIDRFGASAPGNVVMEKLGFTADNVVARARALLAR
ncbi:MAG: transketolase [Actinomycetota bacterium]|nr:transketolase [Actinomycetota bacterium]